MRTAILALCAIAMLGGCAPRDDGAYWRAVADQIGRPAK